MFLAAIILLLLFCAILLDAHTQPTMTPFTYPSVRLDKLSQEREGHLPTGYWLRGQLCAAPKIGEPIKVLRTERAAQHPGEVEPVKLMGLYTSSPVREMVEHEDGSITATTMNSVWRITPFNA